MVEIKETIDILNRIPLFQGLKRRQLERLAQTFVERKYGEGEAIVTQGKGGEGFFIIASGKAEALRVKIDGTKVLLNPLEPMDFFGEMALLTDSLRTASVVTTAPTTCLVLTRWDFHALLRDDADMAITILQELAERFSRVLNTL
ncbi:MAG: cyclic nucleotide-binding domain-containing protein [Anaerolineae bacterium]|nr:cyclic nucleotide-binding domain-containing protein [Anaerolineae bacterium]